MSNYMNSAGAAIMSNGTISTITNYLKREQQIGGYEAMNEAQPRIDHFYTQVCQLIHAPSKEEIAYIDSGSRGWNLVLHGLDMDSMDVFITLSSEYVTNINTLQRHSQRYDKQLIVIPCDVEGRFDIEKIKDNIVPGRTCIALSHATAHGSIVNPVIEIGSIAHQSNSVYIVDGTQSTGQIPINVQHIRCHAFIANGRKWLRGPRGTGFLYVQDDVPISATHIDGANSTWNTTTRQVEITPTARRFEMWERGIADMLGLSNAIEEYLAYDPVVVHERIKSRAGVIRAAIDQHPKLQLIGHRDSVSGIIGFYPLDQKYYDIITDRFISNDITVSYLYDWAFPMHFDGDMKIFRLAPHHDVDMGFIKKIAQVITSTRNAHS